MPREESPMNTMNTTMAADGLTVKGFTTGFSVGAGNTPRFTTKSMMEDFRRVLPLSMSVACKGFRMLLSFDMILIKVLYKGMIQ